MTNSNAFVLKNAGLDAFLFSGVGTEPNGSTLTVLSLLARLGQDPWAEAAKWAGLSKAAATDHLAKDIAQMPLSPPDQADARTTAARLVLLLPPKHETPAEAQPGKTRLPALVLYAALAIGIGINIVLFTREAPPPVPLATSQQISPGADSRAVSDQTASADGKFRVLHQ